MVAPLTPKCCDLRDYAYIPMQIGRLKSSRAWSMCRRNPALAFYLMNTWTAAFQSVPAASLENDDIVLADLAMCDDETWAKVKADVLRGWVECDDGRLYHPVVAEYALEGWLGKVAQRKATAAASAKRSNAAFDSKPFDLMLADAREHLRKINPEARALKKQAKSLQFGLSAFSVDAEDALNEVPEGSPSDHPPGSPSGTPDGQPAGSPHGAPPGSPVGHHPVDRVVHQGESREYIESPSLRSGDACARDALAKPAEEPPRRPPKARGVPTANFEIWYEGYPHKVGRGAAERAFASVMATGSVTLGELVAARDRYIRTKNPDHAWCNPATWLNQRRWLDKPATSLSPPASATPPSSEDPRVDLGGGIQAPYSTIRGVWSKGRWLADWGPRPDQPGCRILPETMAAIMGANAA